MRIKLSKDSWTLLYDVCYVSEKSVCIYYCRLSLGTDKLSLMNIGIMDWNCRENHIFLFFFFFGIPKLSQNIEIYAPWEVVARKNVPILPCHSRIPTLIAESASGIVACRAPTSFYLCAPWSKWT